MKGKDEDGEEKEGREGGQEPPLFRPAQAPLVSTALRQQQKQQQQEQEQKQKQEQEQGQQQQEEED